MINKCDNKIVVITGGTGSIGYAIANNFLQKSVAKVIIIDINEKCGTNSVETLRAEYGKERVEFYKGDVTTDLDILYREIIETYKSVDVLVNCAGIGESRLVEKTININVTALIKWSLKFHEHMRRDKFGKGGTIINISSMQGYYVLPYTPVYQASKFAVLGFGKSLGHKHNFEKFGVRVVTICPGLTDTSLLNISKEHLTDISSGFVDFIKNKTFQRADVVGKATVDIFENAESGTVWEIAKSKALVLIP